MYLPKLLTEQDSWFGLRSRCFLESGLKVQMEVQRADQWLPQRVYKRGSSLQPQALEPLPESMFSFEQ